MWPRRYLDSPQPLDPTLFREPAGLDYFYFRMRQAITECLAKWTEVNFEFDEELIVAAIIYDIGSDPLWSDQGRAFGPGSTRRVLRILKAVQSCLEKSHRVLAVRPQDAAYYRQRAEAQLAELPRPASIILEEIRYYHPEKLLACLAELQALYERYLERNKNLRGNPRARHTALCLRAVFEEYTSHPVTVGNEGGAIPVGRFAECLAELFAVTGQDVNFYRYAREARDLAQDNPELMELRSALATVRRGLPRELDL